MRRSRIVVAMLIGAGIAGCTVKDPLYCSDDHPCAAGLPYCDKDGFFPSSEHIKNTCIEQPYRLHVEVSGAGAVTSEPVGISCPGDCDEIWDNGTEVTLHAMPGGDSVFGGWVGDCDGYDLSCALTATATHSVTARFAPPVHYSVAVQGNGTVVSEPAGINCPGTCDATFPPYSHVKMTSMAASGSAFTSWSGGCSGANPVCESDATKDQTFTATFSRQLTLNIDLTGDGQGHVTSTDGLIDCSSSCTKTIGEGAVITLDHAAFSDSGFDGWSGPCTGEGQCTFTLTTSTTVGAAFRAPWVRTPSFGVLDHANDVVVAGNGDVYVAGSTTPSSLGQPRHGILTKYDRQGNKLWAYDLCGSPTQDCALLSVTLDATNANVVVVGTVFAPSSSSNIDWYVEERTSDGVQGWSRTYGNNFGDLDYAYAVAIDSSGNAYVGGIETVAAADRRALVRQYDSSGSLKWSRSSTFKNSYLYGLTLDSFGVVWAAGYDLNNSIVTPWVGFYSSTGVVGTRKTLAQPSTRDIVGLLSGQLAVVGGGASSAAINVLDASQTSLNVIAEPAATTWLGTCADRSRPYIYAMGQGAGGTASFIGGYDLTGTSIAQHSEPGVGAGSVGCDQAAHDITAVGDESGKFWIKHYYK